MDGQMWLEDVTKRFREAKAQADDTLAQVPFERWSERLDPESNSLVTLVLHLSGNMLSRWSDFLDSDGEKAFRDRDAEFEDAPGLTREALLERWESGWACLFAALAGLGDADLGRTITIRNKPLTVASAINRQVAHYAQHIGQMSFLGKHLLGAAWRTQSIARGNSRTYTAGVRAGRPGA
jgi:hypothetical protein